MPCAREFAGKSISIAPTESSCGARRAGAIRSSGGSSASGSSAVRTAAAIEVHRRRWRQPAAVCQPSPERRNATSKQTKGEIRCQEPLGLRRQSDTSIGSQSTPPAALSSGGARGNWQASGSSSDRTAFTACTSFRPRTRRGTPTSSAPWVASSSDSSRRRKPISIKSSGRCGRDGAKGVSFAAPYSCVRPKAPVARPARAIFIACLRAAGEQLQAIEPRPNFAAAVAYGSTARNAWILPRSA